MSSEFSCDDPHFQQEGEGKEVAAGEMVGVREGGKGRVAVERGLGHQEAGREVAAGD